MATATDTSRRIAQAVSKALTSAGIPQRDAAAQTGIPLTTLSRRLTGYSPFNTDELALIADLCGASVTDLIAQAAA